MVAHNFRHPLDGGYTQTQNHNQWNADVGKYHLGDDWANEATGGTIYATANGEVIYSNYHYNNDGSEGFGNLVTLRHILSDETVVHSYYAHLETRSVEVGDSPSLGDIIGTVGNTGFSTGPHLHFAMFVGADAPTTPLGYSESSDPDIRDRYVDPSIYISEFVPTGSSGPDLIARDLVLSSTDWSDADAIVADFVIENIGDQDATGTPSRVYISTNTTITTSDIVLGQDNGTGTMNPGEVNPEAASFTLDFAALGLSAGTHYVGVLSDPDNAVAESNEGNNVSNVVQVSLSGGASGPDLIAQNLELSSTAWTAGNSISANWEIVNQGDQSASSSASSLYLSTDTNITTSDLLLLTDGTTGTMSVGEVNPEGGASFSVENLPTGTYYAGVIADDTQVIAESIESNNISNIETITIAGATSNSPPEVSIPGQSGGGGSWIRLSDVLSYNDADGDPLEALALWDNQGSNSWWADGGTVDASTNAYVTTSDPSSVYFQFDSSVPSQTLWATAYDGTDWGKWDAFAVSTIGSNNTPPVVSVSNQTAAQNEWLNLGDILSYNDAEGDTLQYLGLWDSEGSDSWWADDNVVDASSGYVTQSDPADVWFRGDSNAGEQAIWVTGNDGTEWGAWDAIILTTTTEAV